jgi:hypothetical protein
MTKKLDLRLILAVGWLLSHRFILTWYKHVLGLP